jgi:delta(3,5)-delta(2,4)-dienoyl-CoA isomerase
LEAANKLAQLIASKSPVAINMTKKSYLYSRDHTVAEGLHHIAVAQGAALQTIDTMQAVSATLSKQKAQFAKL